MVDEACIGWMDEVRHPHPLRRTQRVHGERGTTGEGTPDTEGEKV